MKRRLQPHRQMLRSRVVLVGAAVLLAFVLLHNSFSTDDTVVASDSPAPMSLLATAAPVVAATTAPEHQDESKNSDSNGENKSNAANPTTVAPRERILSPTTAQQEQQLFCTGTWADRASSSALRTIGLARAARVVARNVSGCPNAPVRVAVFSNANRFPLRQCMLVRPTVAPPRAGREGTDSCLERCLASPCCVGYSLNFINKNISGGLSPEAELDPFNETNRVCEPLMCDAYATYAAAMAAPKRTLFALVDRREPPRLRSDPRLFVPPHGGGPPRTLSIDVDRDGGGDQAAAPPQWTLRTAVTARIADVGVNDGPVAAKVTLEVVDVTDGAATLLRRTTVALADAGRDEARFPPFGPPDIPADSIVGRELELRLTAEATNAAVKIAPLVKPLRVMHAADTLLLRVSPRLLDTIATTRTACEAPLLRRGEVCVRGGFRVVGGASVAEDIFVEPAWHQRFANEMLGLRFDDGGNACVRVVAGAQAHFAESGAAEFTHLILAVDASKRCRQLAGASDAESVNVTVRAVFEMPDRGGAFADTEGRGPGAVSLPLRQLMLGAIAAAHRAVESGRGGDFFGLAEPQPTRQPTVRELRARNEDGEDGPPVLVSIAAHECVACLGDLLLNIRQYVRPSVVVVHWAGVANGTAAAAAAERAAVAALLDDTTHHPYALLNPTTLFTANGLRQMSVHAHNIDWATPERFQAAFGKQQQQPNANIIETRFNYSHVLLVASNELFVRPGVVAYIRRFDSVRYGGAPGPTAGLVYEHLINAMDGRFLPQRPVALEDGPDVESAAVALRSAWAGVEPFVARNDRRLAALMRAAPPNIGGPVTTYLSDHVFLEGTFWSRAIAREVVGALRAHYTRWTPADDECDDPEPYPVAEVVVPTLLQNVCARPGVTCGERVSTTLWMNPAWTADELDVHDVRCSPFEVPFAVKRVRRDVNDPVRRLVRKQYHHHTQRSEDC